MHFRKQLFRVKGCFLFFMNTWLRLNIFLYSLNY